ncbi:hypothetical protein GGR54DRAFT_622497 [Hypoxylon sp. NC1633]|nr:hypothetical protein GGR54DRAFT_622497 [Hypoxylon sp. NC1633]
MENYGDSPNFHDAFRGEVARAYLRSQTNPDTYGSVVVSTQARFVDYPTSSHTWLWGRNVATVAMRGLWGCTAVVVISRRGVWMAHCKYLLVESCLILDILSNRPASSSLYRY